MVESVEFSRPGCVQFGYACHCHRWRNSRSTRGTSPYCSQIDGATHMSLVYSCERPLPQKSCAYSTRSCNTDKYIFSLWSNMLNLWNFRNWQFTVYSSVSTMQSARCLSILSSARSVLLLHMVLCSIWTNRLPGKRKENGAESTPQISSNFSHIICTFMWNPA